MRRMLVIGSGGAGKSTFAARLADLTGLPLFHLDALYWKPGWAETPPDQWIRTVDDLLAREAWIMDGNCGGTLERRLAACDTVVFLDLPRHLCLWRVVRRRVRFGGRSRPDMAPGCPERLSWQFLRWIWTYRASRRPRILERLRSLPPQTRVVVLRSRAEVAAFLARTAEGAGPRSHPPNCIR